MRSSGDRHFEIIVVEIRVIRRMRVPEEYLDLRNSVLDPWELRFETHSSSR
jgi:hypothetical protein